MDIHYISRPNWTGCTACSLASPHIITNKYEFDAIRTHINTVNSLIVITGYFKISNDITFDSADFEQGGDFYNSGDGWIPLGHDNGTSWFTGNKNNSYFDGDNHWISNIKIMRYNRMYNGVFATINEGSIKNLKLDNIYTYGKCGCGTLYGVVYSGLAVVDNITITNSNVIVASNSNAKGSGIFASNTGGGTIKNIYISNSTIKDTGYNWYNGMFVENLGGTVENVTMNNCRAELYVESGPIASSVTEGAVVNNFTITNSSFKYMHSDQARSSLVSNSSVVPPSTAVTPPVFNNINIDLLYEGTSQNLFGAGKNIMNNSTIKITHKVQRTTNDLMLINTAGYPSILSNVRLISGYLDANGNYVLVNDRII